MNLKKDLIFYILSFMIPGNLNSTEKVSEAIVQKIQRKQDIINNSIKRIFNNLEEINKFFQENQIKETNDFKYFTKDLVDKYDNLLNIIDINISTLNNLNISINEAKEILKNHNISYSNSDNNQKFISIVNSVNNDLIKCTLKPKLDVRSNIKFSLENFEGFRKEIEDIIKNNKEPLSKSEQATIHVTTIIHQIKLLFENRSFPGFDQINQDSLLKLNKLVNSLNSSLINFPHKYYHTNHIDTKGLEKLLKIEYNKKSRELCLTNFKEITKEIEKQLFSGLENNQETKVSLETTEDTGLGGGRNANDGKEITNAK